MGWGLERRYLFSGDLVLQTALHIGGGDALLGATNSPIIRTAEGLPFIPGASLKGAFRSTVEKLAATVGLPNVEQDVIDQSSAWAQDFRQRLDRLMERAGQSTMDGIEQYVDQMIDLVENQVSAMIALTDAPTDETTGITSSNPESRQAHRKAIQHLKDYLIQCLQDYPQQRSTRWTERDTLGLVRQEWPATALLFGTPYTASKIQFADAYLRQPEEAVIQRRDGVAIDRDSERVMEGLLYNYEVVPPTTRFGFEITLENPDDTDLGLTCLGLSELLGGFFGVGGKRSSGLGRCTLENFQAYELDLTNTNPAERLDRLRTYLTGQTQTQRLRSVPNVQAFVDEQIEALVRRYGNAETAGQ